VSNTNVVGGKYPAVSGDGFSVATVSSDCDVSIYGRASNGAFLEKKTSNYFTCDSMAEGLAITHDTDAIQLNTKESKYNLSCNDPNSRLKTERNDSPIVCMCNDGYVNSGSNGGKILEDGYSCISSLHADNVKVTSESIQFQILNSTANDYTEMELKKRASPNDIGIELTLSENLAIINFSNMKKYTLSQLEPGSRYTVTFLKSNDSSQSLSFPVVTSCSCDHDDIDKTGRPKDVRIVQNNGYVMFNFKDNSKCEEAFSFTRSDYAEEFLADVSEYGVSFTSDYFFIGGSECDSIVDTHIEASDELQYSNLTVGKLFMYCVRAVHRSHYMEHPMGISEAGNRQLTSSDDTCAPHKIRWEASINGKITTEPNAGSLPIENVVVTWELFRSGSETPIGCDGCSGSDKTSEGGAFEIVFNVDDPFFKDKNNVDIPAKIKFSKMSGDISHKFLCNEGEDDCSDDIGIVVYLKHLHFKEQVHIYDDTSIPFSGKVFIADTSYPGSEGCMLSNVEVCLKQEKTEMSELVCGETGSDGTYSLPVIIGRRVDYVDLNYHGHQFRASSNSNFKNGTMIEENGY